VAEWREAVSAESPGPLWVVAQGLSYGRSLAYHFASEILRGLIGSPSDDLQGETERALRAVCAQLGDGEGEEAVPFLAHLLGLPLEERQQDVVRYLDGSALRSGYARAMRGLLRALSTHRPIILVCEDAHWADPSSVELGLDILPIADEERIVVALTSRLDAGAPGWQLIERARRIPGSIEISLSPLTPSEAAVLVRGVLKDDDVPGGLLDAIGGRAEGNPLFIEEVVRMLLARGWLGKVRGGWELAGDPTDEIPGTLYGVLAARIDRLPEEAKRVLQVASVIGRGFSAGLLADVLEALEADDSPRRAAGRDRRSGAA
jgi:predicted ATPase